MNKASFKQFGFGFCLFATWIGAWVLIPRWLGATGLYGDWFQTHGLLKIMVVWFGLAHLTISAMSIAFHRAHTHQAIKLHPIVDYSMQVFLWLTTSMSKLDWVSVHVYHHAHSDTPKDPHSPSQKGLLHVFLLGALDYSKAKTDPEVLKIRSRIPASAFERYISRHLFQGPVALAFALMVFFGPLTGSVLMLLTFAISPLFAVGGVNALAHAFGYQNYESKDESRNLGFLFFLNWIICGELDHNNHHKFPRSPTFAHRWFEFDIGWVYIRLMEAVGLARVTGKVPKYSKASAPLNSQSEVAFVS